MGSPATCRCSPLRVGNRPPSPDGPLALRDDCPEHGVGTAHYDRVLAEHNAHSRELRARADEARRRVSRTDVDGGHAGEADVRHARRVPREG